MLFIIFMNVDFLNFPKKFIEWFGRGCNLEFTKTNEINPKTDFAYYIRINRIIGKPIVY